MEPNTYDALLWTLDIFHEGLGRTAGGEQAKSESYLCTKEPRVSVSGRVVYIDTVILVDPETGETRDERFILSGLPFTARREEVALSPKVAQSLGFTA